jgi:hypothetical protein
MKDEFLYGPGQATKGVNIDPIVAAAEALGKIGIGIADASKRRQMDFSLNQQRLNAELGLAEKSAQQQAELAKLNLIAQTIGGKPKEEKNIGKTIAVVVISVTGLAALGGFLYLINKR